MHILSGVMEPLPQKVRKQFKGRQSARPAEGFQFFGGVARLDWKTSAINPKKMKRFRPFLNLKIAFITEIAGYYYEN